MPELEEGAVYLSDSREWLWAYAATDTSKTPMYGDVENVPANVQQPKLNRRFDDSASWSRTTS